jgi:ribonuclease P protein component
LDEPHGNAVAGLERLRRRADFLRAAKGKRFHARGLTLQAAPRPISLEDQGAGGAPRFGFTVTKQSGGAVRRNRIRRRLKEALRLLKPLPARPGHDYVILARPEALAMPFQTLQAELLRALDKIENRKNLPPIRPDHGRPESVSKKAGPIGRKSTTGRTPKE